MANEVKWSTPISAVTAINGDGTAPTLKALAVNARKLGSEYDNATNKYQYADFELYVRGASAFAAGSYATLYLIPCFDGTNYADGSDSVDASNTLLAGVFTMQAVSTQQRLVCRGIILPPFKFKPYIVNRGSQAFTNTDNENVLKFRAYNDEIQ